MRHLNRPLGGLEGGELCLEGNDRCCAGVDAHMLLEGAEVHKVLAKVPGGQAVGHPLHGLGRLRSHHLSERAQPRSRRLGGSVEVGGDRLGLGNRGACSHDDTVDGATASP